MSTTHLRTAKLWQQRKKHIPQGIVAERHNIMEQEYHKRIIQLEARVHQLEAAMQAILTRLGLDPAEVMPQEPAETRIFHEALLAGNKIKAIQLYRERYGVGLKEAKDAIDAMEGKLR